ncbi:tRNA (cytidine(34)-2'-O)-methyltransferase [Ferrovum myxofaciens]|jgi:tRNA (cytidine/uridine-2'-O-)-methyltransferase|uniref:tRNA (cytidine(34)-2'-O)-methyltransferase n=2 Tax=root TaxID=1 RepID=A0A859ABX9_9PROT|nr:tRNA (cytidine(34)-2'-O)-methyltransferase [Ferrovum myxofaciens]MBW8028830.1 tRNA (uridine(34)/cytosine(34)/5-carboxymethylaminomethyluridine(34)-2'-O)-methyltransferase TrmL [Ferrovum sp.]KXW59040.1 tRNA (cytidine(34)-2'-O)-methyltransferase [Ferrovum myxofaciens]MBU6995809.1 tRNA (cytidine(34)-2'-O)-methyltransferase [Ferrovum myxofaciens]NDU89805.1 tRNA (cytidine(34)-2'-O)-methyltransferase [Ferrovum sp.]QKE39407.1 MAG: tRNA (cytidine(34)-2'-O)-methyltransferase [Ferrovum myxofaciens]
MFDVVLYQPEIPPNTGNIIRLCANTGARLHLVSPLGFEVSDRHLRRAGLDYHEQMVLTVHPDWDACRQTLRERRWFPLTTRGSGNHTGARYEPGDVFLFGPETRGLPLSVLEEFDRSTWIRLPMRPHNRSLNLSNAVAVMVFEAWRQQEFCGAL